MAIDLDFQRQVDGALKDFQTEVYRNVGYVYGAQLNELKASVTEMLGHLWTAAALEHFDAKQPRAYRRTGGIETPLLVDFVPLLVDASDGRRIEVRAEIVLDTKEVLETHLAHQKTLREVDPSGKQAFEIKSKYPILWANGKRQHYSLYPSDVGVIGSMHKQDHEYFLAYMFAGPNSPDQPWVYRALGQPKGKKTNRDKGRGLDLLNKFLAELGARPVSTMKNTMDIDLLPSGDMFALIFEDFRKAIHTNMKMEFRIDTFGSADTVMDNAMHPKAPMPAPVTLSPKEKAWNSLYSKLQPFLNGGK